VACHLGNVGYNVGWNELFDQWEVDLSADDPVFAAIAGVSRFELRSNTSSHTVNSADFAVAYTNLTDHCRSMFAAINTPWAGDAPAAPAPQPAPANAMRQIAESAVWQGCGGGAQIDPDAFLTGEIDGDGLPDVVLDWGAVQCYGAMARPFCGASRCSADVFLSSAYHRKGMPETLLGQGVWLQPLNNGNMGVSVGGALSECYAIGKQSCNFLYYWNGFDLVNLR
jgi:hypothetical protein